MNQLPELLSPAGSYEAAIAAVENGADAIYIGGTMLNARMNAKNFGNAELKSITEYCHERGIKVYVTLNTAVYDRELRDALKYVELLYVTGIDALIVADLGLAELIHRFYPNFPLHASTQASGHNVDCAVKLKEIGFCRMVCAREMTKEEVNRLCKESPIEIEQFVHGALCVSQSGQCLASAMIGGRSGNRGACAQPCRMKYNGAYPLSLKDSALAEHIPDIIRSGVASLKIEGRMKSPAYVGGVTRIYRRLLDESRAATESEMRELAALFSRGGFTDGYYMNKINSDMNGIRSEDDKAATAKATAKESAKAVTSISVKNANHAAKHKVSTLSTRPAFELEPRFPNPEATYSIPKAQNRKKPQKPVFTARFAYPEQITRSDFFSVVYLPLDKFRPDCGANGVVLPPTLFDRDRSRAEQLMEAVKAAGAEHALVCNIGHIELAKKYGFIIHGDYRLNIFNTQSAKLYINEGMRDVMLSPELTLPQIRDIAVPKCSIVYGRLPLMLLTKPLDARVLHDRTGASFPIIREFGYDELLNSVPLYMADKAKELDNYGVRGRHIFFTTESRRECESVIKAFERSEAPKYPVRRIQA